MFVIVVAISAQLSKLIDSVDKWSMSELSTFILLVDLSKVYDFPLTECSTYLL